MGGCSQQALTILQTNLSVLYIALNFNLSTVGISSEHVVNSFANLPVFRRKSDEFSSVVQGYGSNKRYIIG